jgi:predicted transposase YbfD/YdcC
MDILEFIEQLSDPRIEGKVKHSLKSILFGALCGVLSGCESWFDIADYCEAKHEWLSQYVSFPNGIPSGWTFRRVFTLLEPSQMEQLLRSHAEQIINNNGVETKQIAVDGKSIRGSDSKDFSCLHSVSAWCHENGLVLGESEVSSKSNEITAIPILLNSLALKGKTVSIDAAGCQKSIAKLIKEKEGDYVLGLKSNHPKLMQAAISLKKEQGEHSINCILDAFDEEHGRVVRRRYFGYDASSLPNIDKWLGAKSILAVETISSKSNDSAANVSAQWRYYLSSHTSNNKELPDYIRNHWSIENKLHWILDVHFKEDDDQKAERRSVRSFALLKRIALNIVRSKDTTPKRSMRRKLKRSAWDNQYLANILLS